MTSGKCRNSSISRTRLCPGNFGMLLPPDSGSRSGSTERTGGTGAACREQSMLRQTILHPSQRKRRAGSRMTTDFDLEVDLASEGTQRGTPRKRALFGRGRGELQKNFDVPEWPHSSGVELTDTVAHLQREVEDLRTESMFNHTGRTPSSFPARTIPRFLEQTPPSSTSPYRPILAIPDIHRLSQRQRRKRSVHAPRTPVHPMSQTSAQETHPQPLPC